jgi:hypothetical protein
MGTSNAWLRDNFMTNYIKEIEFIVNGQTIEQRNYDHVARIVKMMTQPDDREGHDQLRTDWGLPFDAPVNTTRTANQIAEDSLKTLTPFTLPATENGTDDPQMFTSSPSISFASGQRTTWGPGASTATSLS